MRRLGKVLHLSKSGSLIVKLESTELPKVGVEVCNSKLEKVGFVSSVLGPVKAPYLSVQPVEGQTATPPGRVLYQGRASRGIP